MRYVRSFKLLPLIFLMTSAVLHAESETKKYPTLEEMSTEELREALRKSHAEIESRLGSSGPASSAPGSGSAEQGGYASLSEKRAYETSVQSRINMLDYKIQALETVGEKDWGYSQNDARKLKDIQIKAREQLNKIRTSNNDGWKANKQILESLLREAANYQA